MSNANLISALILAGVAVLAVFVWMRGGRVPPRPLARGLVPLSAVDWLGIDEAAEGIFICGGVGAGKTTGPGENLARALLRAGAGFCVLTAKVDEYARWVRLCKQTDREADLVRFAPGTGLCCDMLNYELAQPGATVEGVAQLLDTLVEISGRSGGGQGDEAYWRMSAQKGTRHIIRGVWLGLGRCSLEDCYAFLSSAPNSPEQTASEAWRAESFCWQCLAAASVRQGVDEIELDLCASYWMHEWPELSDKTRSIIFSMVMNVFDKFMHELRPMVCGQTNVRPDDPQRGKVIVLDMPVLRWGAPGPGQFFQVLFKMLVQRATLARDLSGSPRPVVVWVDEAQFFCTSQDSLTQTVARQSKLISVVLTQNLPTLYAQLGGGEKARHEADGWIGNHMTKILCANSDHTTNKYMSDIIGESLHLLMTGNNDIPGFGPMDGFLGTPAKGTAGFGEHMLPDFPAAEFAKLAKGGKANDFTVEAVVFMAGRIFRASGLTWLRARFRQKFD